MLDVSARITSANQKWMEVPGDEDDGIDLLIEFNDDAHEATGARLYLQLKSGDSYTRKRSERSCHPDVLSLSSDKPPT